MNFVINNRTLPQAPDTKKRSQLKKGEDTLNLNRYCWTHGYKVAKGHNSHTCSNRAEGHQVEATRANPLEHKERKPSTCLLGGTSRNKYSKTNAVINSLGPIPAI